MKHSIFFILLLLTAYGCGNKSITEASPNSAGNNAGSTAVDQPDSAGAKAAPSPTPSSTAAWQRPKDGIPRNVLDFYMMLPAKYFVWDGCARDDEACNLQRKIDDLDPLIDIPNGFLSIGSDLQSSDFTIFKKKDSTYLAAISDGGTTWDNFYVTEFRNGRFVDMTKDVIPDHSNLRSYELPRQGTTVTVRRVERNEDGVPDIHEILYYLDWKDDRFIQRKVDKDQKE